MNRHGDTAIAAGSPGTRPPADFLARDVGLSTIAEFTVIALSLVALRLAAGFGSVGFGAYAIARRGLQLVAYPALLGLGTSLPRLVARKDTASAHHGIRTVLVAALLLVTPVIGLITLLVFAFPTGIAQLLYGDAGYSTMAPALGLAIAGLALHTLAYGFYRGRMAFTTAAALHIFGAGAVPIAALVLADGPVMAIALSGLGWVAGGAAALTWVFAAAGGSHPVTVPAVLASAGALARHGLLRVPGEGARVALFALPVVAVAHRSGADQAGYLSLGLSIVSLVASALAGLGVVLLPFVSHAAAHGAHADAGRRIARILILTIAVAGAGSLAAYALLPAVVPRFLGGAYAAASSIVQTTSFGILPYAVYTVLRGPLDGIAVWPYNSINLCVSLGVVAVLVFPAEGFVSPAAAVVIALALLGALSWISWQYALRGSTPRQSALPALSC